MGQRGQIAHRIVWRCTDYAVGNCHAPWLSSVHMGCSFKQNVGLSRNTQPLCPFQTRLLNVILNP